MRSKVVVVSLALAFGLVGCGGYGDGGGGGPGVAIAKTAGSSGDGQTGQISTQLALPLRVVVTDGGYVSAGHTVTWGTINPGGSFNPATSQAAGDGVATTMWTLGSMAGGQAATATLAGATGSPVSFSAMATAPAVPVLSKAPLPNGDNEIQTVGQIVTLRARVTLSGVAQSGVTVNWATTDGSVSAPSSTTDGGGVATIIWTLGGVAGQQTALATVPGAMGSPQTYAVSAAAINTILVADGRFGPTPMSVTAGTSIMFLWAPGAAGHNVTPSSANPSALPASPGLPGIHSDPFNFVASFPSAGVFRYFCSIHGAQDGSGNVSLMAGTLTVTP